MKADLMEKVSESTWHEVVFFQLRSLSLPDAFEAEIQNTEVKGQDIQTAVAETTRDQVQFTTNVEVARLAQNATVETAKGLAQKTLFEAEAVKSTIKSVVEMQAASFKDMKSQLSFDNDQLLQYLKTNLIKDYSDSKMIINLS